MPLDDVGADDGDDLRPPPHPDDRLWRHPSELDAPAGGSAGGRSGPLDRPTPWGPLMLAASVGAALAAGVLLAPGLRDRVPGGRVEQVTASPTLSSPLVGDLDDGGQGPGPTDDTGDELGDDTGDDSGDDVHAMLTRVAEELAPALVSVEGETTTGSGFVMRADGMVITSAGLVEEPSDAELLKVSFGDGQTTMGTLVGTDPVTDVAVLDLPGDGYPTMALADDLAMERGAMAALLSADDETSENPVSIASGALTSSGWSLERDDLPPLNGLMQLAAGSDAAARGGPVVNERGQVMGLTTWSSDDWSYATRIDVASKVANDLMATGSAQHCWLGIEGKNAKGSIGAADTATAGVVITDVAPQGPAANVLRTGDIIVAIDGEPIPDLPSLITALLLRSPGDGAEITAHHGKGTSLEKITVTLQAYP